MLPSFLVIGAPRAGTTWIAKNLSEHPSVFVPFKKEIHFFDSYYDRGQAFYESYFDEAADRIAVDRGWNQLLHEMARNPCIATWETLDDVPRIERDDRRPVLDELPQGVDHVAGSGLL